MLPLLFPICFHFLVFLFVLLLACFSLHIPHLSPEAPRSKGQYSLSLAAVTNYHKLRNWKELPFIMSKFPWVRHPGTAWVTASLFRISRGQNRGIDCVIFVSQASGKNPLLCSLRLFLNSVPYSCRTEVSLPCWLSAGALCLLATCIPPSPSGFTLATVHTSLKHQTTPTLLPSCCLTPRQRKVPILKVRCDGSPRLF